MNKNNTDLDGKIAEVKYETGLHFKLEYLEGGRMKWTSLRQEDNNATEMESITVFKLNDGIYNINWVESNEIVVSQSIDINNNIVKAFITTNDKDKYGRRAVIILSGVYQFIDQNNNIDNTPFTNLQIIRSYWNEFLVNHDPKVFERYFGDDYIQHNPYLQDGIEPFRNWFMSMFESKWKQASFEIKAIHSDQNIVYVHNLGKESPEDIGNAVVDIYRLEKGKIVEHWDVIQPISEQSISKHPMF
ncbi:TPA: nuclear transport factor 2 family protein [Elizabethkingia anophelis]|uniref:nuclear transport factor 2 family protein n=1 Tax=Elizabethkingia anophelis TaxID=1117645 RepID=UPI000994CAF5|nr:nuclear transport factor 2 family protein [Elizabethkingia anophelis]AQW94873.1 hypothetical protein BBD30_12165 [Elizabethkingia anophelis]MCL1690568.1 nuclear transport factor 2 family protein [Elizabethkingia anophelis]MDV3950839.1 hypothetical protein [Elizabethkingia anophelis]MDV4010135.1 hypothetical protein [Elizabethkingia anophelis]MYY49904.1 hypothetical protein [Elizabethkingia anophelis]